MCEIKRVHFPCCNREKWIITKNPSFCESPLPGTRCRPYFCMFIGDGVEEVKNGVCQECLRKVWGRDEGQRRIAGRPFYGKRRERRRSMGSTKASENPDLDKVLSGRVAHPAKDRNRTSATSLLRTPNCDGRSPTRTPAVDTERGCLLHCADEMQAMGMGTISESNFAARPSSPFGSSFWETQFSFPSTRAFSGVSNSQVDIASSAQGSSSSGNGPQFWGINSYNGIQLLQPPLVAPGSSLRSPEAEWQNAQLVVKSPHVNFDILDEEDFDFYGNCNLQQSDSNLPQENQPQNATHLILQCNPPMAKMMSG
jgi:hypothetical protein